MVSFESLSHERAADGNVQWDIAIVLAELSKAVYEDGSELISSVEGLGANLVTPLSRGSSEGVVASDDDALIIAFRGTESVADRITNIRILGDSVGGGRMHRGFWRSINALYRSALKAAKEQGIHHKKIWITGHSLGGAMAAIFAYRLLTEEAIRATGVVTFGQPLVMTEVPAQEMLDQLQSDYVRFVNRGDIVSRLLPNYRHTGARVYLKDDGFSFREPKIAFSAKPSQSQRESVWMIDEDEEELQLMTEAELQELERNIKQGSNAPVLLYESAGVGAVPSWLNPFTPHFMDSYLPRLRQHGQVD